MMKTSALVLFVLATAFATERVAKKAQLQLSDNVKSSLQSRVASIDARARVLDLNAITDDVLEQLDAYMIEAGLDPAKLRDIHEEFEYKPLLITYHGELDLKDGWVQDLSTLYRSGEVTITLTSEKILLTLPLALKDLVFDYQYSAKFMNLGPTGGIDGKVTDIKLELVLSVDEETNYLTLESFEITKTGKISLKFTGNPLVDWMTNLFTSVITTVLHNVIISIAESVLRGNVEAAIDQINDYIQNNYPPTYPSV